MMNRSILINPKLIMPFIQYGALVLAVALSAFMFSGCGKKAMPVAPSKAPLVGIEDLTGVLREDTVRLTWHHQPENTKAVGYLVLRAQSALTQPHCPGCPQLFQKVDTVPVDKTARDQRVPMEFYQTVTTGFRYVFKVRPYGSKTGSGPDSNLVTLTYPKEE